jgi:hypothetical protein
MADQRDDLARLHIEVDVAQRGELPAPGAEGLADILDLDNGFAHVLPLSEIRS